MKRIILAITAMLTIAVSAQAMSYEQARREALFLTDKMAYELNLTDEQYDAAYEINLDYLMGVTSRDDVYGTYWTRRNLDFSYILLEWQWTAFQAATYFYRPLYWSAGYWHFGIYARYPRRDYFYFSRPTVYVSYRGGHSWHSNGGRSYYQAHRNSFSHSKPNSGMRDRWDRGDFRNEAGSGKNSSTHVTVNKGNNNGTTSGFGGSRTSGAFGNRQSTTTTTKRPQTTTTPSRQGISYERNATINKQTGTAVTSKSTPTVISNTTARPHSTTKTTTTTTTTRPQSTSATRTTTTVRPATGSPINRNSSTVRSTTSGISRSSGTAVRSSSSGSTVKSTVRSSSGKSSSSSKGSFGGRR